MLPVLGCLGPARRAAIRMQSGVRGEPGVTGLKYRQCSSYEGSAPVFLAEPVFRFQAVPRVVSAGLKLADSFLVLRRCLGRPRLCRPMHQAHDHKARFDWMPFLMSFPYACSRLTGVCRGSVSGVPRMEGALRFAPLLELEFLEHQTSFSSSNGINVEPLSLPDRCPAVASRCCLPVRGLIEAATGDGWPGVSRTRRIRQREGRDEALHLFRLAGQLFGRTGRTARNWPRSAGFTWFICSTAVLI